MEIPNVSLNDETAAQLINSKVGLDERIEKLKEIQESMLHRIENMESEKDPRFDALDQDLDCVIEYFVELRAIESFWKSLQANSDFRPCHYPGNLCRVRGEQHRIHEDSKVFDILVVATDYNSATAAADDFLRYSSDANEQYQCSDFMDVTVTYYGN